MTKKTPLKFGSPEWRAKHMKKVSPAKPATKTSVSTVQKAAPKPVPKQVVKKTSVNTAKPTPKRVAGPKSFNATAFERARRSHYNLGNPSKDV